MIPTPRPSAPRPSAVGHGAGFWVIAGAFLVAMAFSAVPAPLWRLYQEREGFSTLMVTVAFAAYAVGVMASLFVAGHVSDWLGRRRVLLPAVLVEAVAAVCFLASTSFVVVVVARIVCGVATGMITATATAHLSELHAAARPGTGHTRSELVSTAANLGGFAAGPLLAGLLAEYVAGPLYTPYLVFLALLLLGAVGVALVPETVELAEERPAYRPQRVSVPIAARPRYFAAAGAGFVAFSVLALFNSVAPGFVAETMHQPSRAIAGGVAFAVFGAAATTQMGLRRASARTQLAAGMGLLVVGLVAVTAAVWVPSLPVFVLGGIVAGAGAGVLVKGTVSMVVELALPAVRGEALAGLFLVAYIGLALPIVGLGLASEYVPDRVALLAFTVAMVAVLAGVSRRLLTARLTAR